jgi:hypothetical protein
MNYSHLDDFKRNVSIDDNIHFKINDEVLVGQVREDFVTMINRGNDIMFIKLKIKDVHAFASEHYGYTPLGGIWPRCKCGDYAALTRLLVALFERIEGSSSEPRKYKTIYLRN